MIKLMSHKIIFAIIVTLNLKIKQMNVKIIFLYDYIKEKIYVEQFLNYNNNINHVLQT